MSKGTVISLCDRTGNMVKPWVDAGYDAVIVDLQHFGDTTKGRIRRIGMDVRDPRLLSILKAIPNIVMVFAFPPCTHLAGSGARWWAVKGLGPLIEGLSIVEACRAIIEALGAPGIIENPVGRLGTIWREPDYTFDPCDYGGYLTPPGDKYTKRTCLWVVVKGFLMPPPAPVQPEWGSMMHTHARDADERSVTPMGFAVAVFQENALKSKWEDFF